MVDREAIENYRPPASRVESVDGDRLRIYCGDELPAIGSAIALTDDEDRGPLYAVTERHAGARRVDAWLPLRPDWVRPHVSAAPTGQPAGFAAPTDAAIVPRPQMIRPMADGDILLRPPTPEWTEIDGSPLPLAIGVDVLDVMAPICSGGVNLIIDTTDDGEPSRRLCQKIEATLAPDALLIAGDEKPELGEQVDDRAPFRVIREPSLRSQIAALQFVIALAPVLRDSEKALAVIDLPTLHSPQRTARTPSQVSRSEGVGAIIDRLGRHLVSTADSQLTSVFVLRLPDGADGLADIIETLHLGEVETTIYIDNDGRLDPRRSLSRCELDDDQISARRELLRVLNLARQADDKASLLGEAELSDAERRAMDRVDQLRPFL